VSESELAEALKETKDEEKLGRLEEISRGELKTGAGAL
jgi:hypothetical protein